MSSRVVRGALALAVLAFGRAESFGQGLRVHAPETALVNSQLKVTASGEVRLRNVEWSTDGKVLRVVRSTGATAWLRAAELGAGQIKAVANGETALASVRVVTYQELYQRLHPDRSPSKLDNVRSALENAKTRMGRGGNALWTDVFADLSQRNLTMKDLWAFKADWIAQKAAELQRNGVPLEQARTNAQVLWSSEGEWGGVERRLMFERKRLVIEAWTDAVRSFEQNVKGSPLLSRMDIGGWATEALNDMRFEGDIDFSVIVVDAESAAHAATLKRLFIESMLKRFGMDSRMEGEAAMRAIDAVCTIHGEATSAVYIGEYGRKWAEKDMAARGKVLEVKTFTDAAGKTHVRQVELTKVEREALLCKLEEQRTGTPVDTAEITLNNQEVAGIALELLRHLQADAIDTRFSTYEKMLKLAKYTERAAREFRDLTQRPVMTDIVHWAQRVVEIKQSKDAAYTGNRYQRIVDVFRATGRWVDADWPDNPEVFLKDLGEQCRVEVERIAADALDYTQKKINAIRDADERARQQEDLRKVLESEQKVFAKERVAFPDDAKMALDSSKATVDVKAVFGDRAVEYVKTMSETAAGAKLAMGYVWHQAGNSIDKVNGLLDQLDDRTLQRLRECDVGVTYTNKKGQATRISVKAINDGLNKTFLGKIGNNTAFKGISLASEMKAYYDAFASGGDARESATNLATEFFRRRVPGGGAVEAVIMENYTRAGIEIAYLVFPPAAIPEALIGLGYSAGKMAKDYYDTKVFEGLKNDLYAQCEFEAVPGTNEARWQLTRLVHEGHWYRRPELFVSDEDIWPIFQEAIEGDPLVAQLQALANHPAAGRVEAHFVGQIEKRETELSRQLLARLIAELEKRKAAERLAKRGIGEELLREMRETLECEAGETLVTVTGDAAVDGEAYRRVMVNYQAYTTSKERIDALTEITGVELRHPQPACSIDSLRDAASSTQFLAGFYEQAASEISAQMLSMKGRAVDFGEAVDKAEFAELLSLKKLTAPGFSNLPEQWEGEYQAKLAELRAKYADQTGGGTGTSITTGGGQTTPVVPPGGGTTTTTTTVTPPGGGQTTTPVAPPGGGATTTTTNVTPPVGGGQPTTAPGTGTVVIQGPADALKAHIEFISHDAADQLIVASGTRVVLEAQSSDPNRDTYDWFLEDVDGRPLYADKGRISHRFESREGRSQTMHLRVTRDGDPKKRDYAHVTISFGQADEETADGQAEQPGGDPAEREPEPEPWTPVRGQGNKFVGEYDPGTARLTVKRLNWNGQKGEFVPAERGRSVPPYSGVEPGSFDVRVGPPEGADLRGFNPGYVAYIANSTVHYAIIGPTVEQVRPETVDVSNATSGNRYYGQEAGQPLPVAEARGQAAAGTVRIEDIRKRAFTVVWTNKDGRSWALRIDKYSGPATDSLESRGGTALAAPRFTYSPRADLREDTEIAFTATAPAAGVTYTWYDATNRQPVLLGRGATLTTTLERGSRRIKLVAANQLGGETFALKRVGVRAKLVEIVETHELQFECEVKGAGPNSRVYIAISEPVPGNTYTLYADGEQVARKSGSSLSQGRFYVPAGALRDGDRTDYGLRLVETGKWPKSGRPLPEGGLTAEVPLELPALRPRVVTRGVAVRGPERMMVGEVAQFTADVDAGNDPGARWEYRWTVSGEAEPIRTPSNTLTHKFAAPGQGRVSVEVRETRGGEPVEGGTFRSAPVSVEVAAVAAVQTTTRYEDPSIFFHVRLGGRYLLADPMTIALGRPAQWRVTLIPEAPADVTSFEWRIRGPNVRNNPGHDYYRLTSLRNNGKNGEAVVDYPPFDREGLYVLEMLARAAQSGPLAACTRTILVSATLDQEVWRDTTAPDRQPPYAAAGSGASRDVGTTAYDGGEKVYFSVQHRGQYHFEDPVRIRRNARPVDQNDQVILVPHGPRERFVWQVSGPEVTETTGKPSYQLDCLKTPAPQPTFMRLRFPSFSVVGTYVLRMVNVDDRNGNEYGRCTRTIIVTAEEPQHEPGSLKNIDLKPWALTRPGYAQAQTGGGRTQPPGEVRPPAGDPGKTIKPPKVVLPPSKPVTPPRVNKTSGLLRELQKAAKAGNAGAFSSLLSRPFTLGLGGKEMAVPPDVLAKLVGFFVGGKPPDGLSSGNPFLAAPDLTRAVVQTVDSDAGQVVVVTFRDKLAMDAGMFYIELGVPVQLVWELTIVETRNGPRLAKANVMPAGFQQEVMAPVAKAITPDATQKELAKMFDALAAKYLAKLK